MRWRSPFLPAGFQAYSRNPVLSSPNAAWRSRRGQWRLRRICQCLDCRPEVFLLPPPPERGAEEKQRHSCLGAWALPQTRWHGPCRPRSWVTRRSRQLGGTVCGAPTHALGQGPTESPDARLDLRATPCARAHAGAFSTRTPRNSSSHKTGPSAEENRSAQRRKQQSTVGAPEDTRGSHRTDPHVSSLRSPQGVRSPCYRRAAACVGAWRCSSTWGTPVSHSAVRPPGCPPLASAGAPFTNPATRLLLFSILSLRGDVSPRNGPGEKGGRRQVKDRGLPWE